jgi:FkbM family methyltransferase
MLDRTNAYGLDFYFPAADTAVGASLKAHGEFSRVELDLLIEHATGDTGSLIDVGANIGSVGLPFAKAKPGWRVDGIEAHRGLAALLAANAVANGLSNFEPHHAAGAHMVGAAPFPQPPLDAARNYGEVGFHMTDEPRENVLLLTLDSIARPNLQLVKVDVEGSEGYVLRGASAVIAARRAIWVCEAGVSRQEVVSTFLGAGYAVYWFYVPFVTPQAARGGVPADPAKGDANVVAVPPGRRLLWDLPRVSSADEARPGDGSAYPYLARYGYARE